MLPIRCVGILKLLQLLMYNRIHRENLERVVNSLKYPPFFYRDMSGKHILKIGG